MSGPRDHPETPRSRSRRGGADFYDQRGSYGPGPRPGAPDFDEAGVYGEGHYDEDHYDEDHYDDEEYGGEGYYPDDEDGHYHEGYYDPAGVAPTGPGPRGASRGRHRRARRSGHRVLKALGIIVVLILIIAGAGLIWARSQIDPGGHRGSYVTVVIPKGSTSAIGNQLAAKGVVHQGWLFALYVRLHGYGPLYPGTYRLQKNSPYSAAIAALRAGPKPLTENVVIPEGYTVAQIAQRVAALPHMGLSASRFLAAADNGSVRSPYEPAGVNNLEGLLFPATYQVRQGESEVDILEEMVGTFDDRVQALGLSSAASRLGMTPYQVITVASIVEREAKMAGDRPDVASAIYNRLHIGMKLGADSTQTYYLRLTHPSIQPTAAQLDQPGPYNTRTNTGLPPTPIADPGLASLQAAANPAATKYLYFVEINPDGKLGFAATDAGFEQLRQQCQRAGLC